MSIRVLNKLIAFIVLSFVCLGSLHAESIPSLSPSTNWKLIQVLEDSSAELNVAQVVNQLGEFKYLTEMPSYGTSSSHFWFYLNAADLPKTKEVWIEFDNPGIDYVNFYHLKRVGQGLVAEQSAITGDTQLFSSRPVNYRSYLFPADLAAVDGVLIEVHGESPILVPFSMGTPQEAFEDLSLKENLILFLYGIIFAMTMYNLIVFLGTGYPQYGWYVVYMASMAISLLFSSGYGYAYVWHDNIWMQNNIGYIAYSTFIWGGFQFTRSFLNMFNHLIDDVSCCDCAVFRYCWSS